MQDNNSSNFVLTVDFGNLEAINLTYGYEESHIFEASDYTTTEVQSVDDFIHNSDQLIEDEILEDYMGTEQLKENDDETNEDENRDQIYIASNYE